MVKQKSAKDQLAGLITQTVLKGKKSLPPSQVATHFQRDKLRFTLEEKLHKAFERRERKIRLAWTQAVTKESLPSKDCSSLTVNSQIHEAIVLEHVL